MTSILSDLSSTVKDKIGKGKKEETHTLFVHIFFFIGIVYSVTCIFYRTTAINVCMIFVLLGTYAIYLLFAGFKLFSLATRPF